jgi:predicted CXXCH cytochrome family protein
MKRLVTVLAVASAVLIVFGAVSFAAVVDTPHNISAAAGICSNCHVPHLAGGERLWPTAETATPQYGDVGPLCYSCHDGSVTVSATVTTTAWDIPADRTAAAGGSHGLNRSGATGGYPTTVVSNTLPYGDDTAGKVFECTTCHDPHNDPSTTGDNTALFLLRLDVEALCDNCHTARGTGDGTWGAQYGPNNPGTHPVGDDITADNDDAGNSPIDIGMAGTASDLHQPYTTGGVPDRHDLAGHLTEGTAPGTGGTTCTTCHAVHGPIDPEEGPATSIPEDLLTVAQSVTSGGIAVGDTFTANGGEGIAAANALCAGCHGAAPASTWNPGGTGFSHPSNDLDNNTAGDIATIPAGWPYATDTNTAAEGVVNPICESCHVPHTATANSHILRSTEATICGQCHVGGFAGHHPIGTTLLTDAAMTGVGAGSGADDGNIGNGDPFDCQDCHNSLSGGGAHNWPAGGMPDLDPDWYPDVRNGRVARGATPPYTPVANQSRSCLLCHTNNDSRQAPTQWTADNDNAPYGAGDEYQDSGDGTHWLGTTTLDWTNGEFPNGTGFDARSDQWVSTGATGFDGYSVFGGTGAAPEVVCESCHSLNPNWNDGMDASDYANARADASLPDEELVEDQAELCQGCHGHDPAVSTPHPMTSDTVTKAVDLNATPTTLITFGQTRTGPPAPWNASFMNADALDNAWYPGSAQMNCNSCHQPHDTNEEVGTWILEMLSTDVSGGTQPAQTGTLYGSTYNYEGALWAQPYEALCYDCHAY